LLTGSRSITVPAVKRAQNLEQAAKLLDPRPLDFTHTSTDEAADPDFYLQVPARKRGNIKLPGPMERLRQRLLGGGPDTKVFLSGHVGSGKSTELSRLAIDPEIRERFHVTMLRFEEQEWATLDSSQVLFRLAGALSQHHEKLLSGNARLEKAKRDAVLHLSEAGIDVRDETVPLPLHRIVHEVKQEHLRLSDVARRQFRDFGEKRRTFLQDLLRMLIGDIEEGLSQGDGPNEVLVIVDDLDKVRGAEEQREIFGAKLNSLFVPPCRILYTLPTGVLFGENSTEVRANVEHLYPVRVLRKTAESGEVTFDPQKAYTDERIGFFHELVTTRVEKELISEDAVRLAAIYSGGVLREFFRLLRDGIRLAVYNELEAVDEPVMSYAIEEAKLRDSVGLYTPDHQALVHVHLTNDLGSADDRRYLDLGRVLECYNAAPWFQVNPLLWHVLERHAKK
jgi:hypothetical protein